MNKLLVRTISGAVFAGLVVASLLIHPIFFGVLFLLCMLVAMCEFYHISIGNLFYFTQSIAIVAAVVFFVLVFLHNCLGLDSRWCWAALLPLCMVQISTIFLSVNEKREFSRFIYIYGGLFYVALPFSLASCLVFRNGTFDGLLLLSFFILIWVNDIGAYLLGSTLGQRPNARKLAPSISPKKSWIGFWSGIVMCTGASVALKYLGFIDVSLVHSFAIGFIVAIGAVAGDLCESVWKRYFKVKDSGDCIPGHGGMLDRFDSSIIAIPLVSVYMSLFDLF